MLKAFTVVNLFKIKPEGQNKKVIFTEVKIKTYVNWLLMNEERCGQPVQFLLSGIELCVKLR